MFVDNRMLNLFENVGNSDLGENTLHQLSLIEILVIFLLNLNISSIMQ